MTESVQYIPRTLAPVEAMQYNAWDGSSDELKDWITGLISAGNEEGQVTVSDTGMGMFMVLLITPAEEEEEDDTVETLLQVSNEQYVFLDEDGFHVLGKSVFDALYKPVASS